MNYAFLTLGTDDLQRALGLWCDHMGLEEVQEQPRIGDLEHFWALPRGALLDARMLETVGAPAGRLLLLAFSESAPRVRDHADPRDLCPKNLDVNVVDLPARYRALCDAGLIPRSAPVSYAIDDLQVREVQFSLPEGVNLVLAEILGEPLCTTWAGFGAVTSTVTTVADLDAEEQFFRTLGFQAVGRHDLAGPEIERMIGLPPGGGLTISLHGAVAHRFGRAELVRYQPSIGQDLYARTALPAIGLLRAAIDVEDLDCCARQCREAGYRILKERSFGTRRGRSLQSPAGWWIDLLE